jgi:Zn-dependent peptidase ImmA (M78 family)
MIDRDAARIRDPWRLADALGIRVETVPGLAHDGLWLLDRRRILLRAGMRAIQERSVLAHELGHAAHAHADGRPAHEAEADRWAADLLVDPARLVEAMRSSDDAARWSLEIGVTTRLLGNWLERRARELAFDRSDLAA